MDLGAILLILAVFLLVGLFLAQPFGRRLRRGFKEDAQLSALLAERDRVIQSLQELDFDHTLGKIPEEEYPHQRNELLQKGAAILKELDERMPQGGATGRLQTAIAAPPDAAGADDQIESLVAARRAARKSKSGGFCPKCGKPVLSNDRFCPHCGRPVG